MSTHKFDPKCADCRPVLLDMDGKRLPADDPYMACVLAVWDVAPYEEQLAFHSVCVKNSRDENDLKLLGQLQARIEEASKKLKDPEVNVVTVKPVQKPGFWS